MASPDRRRYIGSGERGRPKGRGSCARFGNPAVIDCLVFRPEALRPSFDGFAFVVRAEDAEKRGQRQPLFYITKKLNEMLVGCRSSGVTVKVPQSVRNEVQVGQYAFGSLNTRKIVIARILTSSASDQRRRYSRSDSTRDFICSMFWVSPR